MVSRDTTRPHHFEPLTILDNWTRNGRCTHCLYPKHGHPFRHLWTLKRSSEDKRQLTFSEAASFDF